MNVRLDSICDIIMGQAPAGEEYNDKGEGLPLLAGAGDFKNGRPVAKKFTRVVTKQCIDGDLVIGIRASIGDKVIADRPYCLGRGVAVIRPRAKGVAPRYLWHWMTAVRPELERKAKGATFKQVNRADIGELKLALPTPEEQRRIASILDQAEELRAKRRTAIALLDQLPQAIFLDMFGDPETNPMNLAKLPIGSLANIKTGGTPSRTREDNYGGAIPWVKTGEVTGHPIRSTEESLTEKGLKSSNCQLFPVGSVVIAMYGQGKTRGRCSVLEIEATTNQACAVVLPSSQFSSTFLFEQLSMSYEQLRQMGRGGNQPNLNLSLVSGFEVLVPPKEQQDHFAVRVEAIHRAKAAQQTSLTELDALFTSLQAGAFGHEPAKQIPTSSRKTEKANSDSPSGSSVIDRLIESYRDVNIEALGAARKAIDFPELAGIKLAREGMEWSTALSGMLAKQTEMSALMASVITPPRLPAYGELFASFGAVNGIAKLMEDSLFPSRKLTSLIDSIAASQLTGMGGALESIRRLTVANSLDTSVAHMMAGFAKHQTAIDVITQGWRNSMWDDIQKSSLMFERLQASSIPSEILEIGSLERFNAVRLLRSTTQDRIWDDDPEADTAIEIVRTEYLDSVEAGLLAIDPRLLKMFQGAKLAGKSQNVDRARHVAVSLREMTTHLLHILAPTAAIKSWSTSDSDFANGKPTRASRIRFIYSRYGTEVLDFFDGDIKEAIKWIDRINGETHTLDGFESDGAIEALIARFEGIALSLIRGARGFE